MTNKIKKNVLDYQVIIFPDTIIGSNKRCFTAYCPVLELADNGSSIEEALKNISSLIKFHLECLKKEKLDIPEDFSPLLVTTARVSVSMR